MYEEKESPELKKFEAALSALAPRTDRLDRDRLMFLAGQQSVLGATAGLPSSAVVPSSVACESQSHQKIAHKKSSFFWPTAFTAMSAIAAALLIMLLQKPEPQIVERIVERPIPASAITNNSERPSQTETNQALAFLLQTENRNLNKNDSPYSFLAMRQQILAHGVDSLKPNGTETPSKEPVYTRSLTNQELLKEILGTPDLGPG